MYRALRHMKLSHKSEHPYYNRYITPTIDDGWCGGLGNMVCFVYSIPRY